MSSSSIRAVIFDYDGVIANTEWLHCETFCGVLEEEGIVLTPADHEERFLGINDWAGFAKAFEEVGRTLSREAANALVERKSASYSRRLGEVGPFAGVVDLVGDLSQRCFLAIASGGRGAEIEAVLRAHDLRRYFRALISADDVTASKPAPESYLKALAALRRADSTAQDLEPCECLVIEDSVYGIQSARAAGMRCIAVGHSFPRERLSQADLVVERIADLSAERLLAFAG